MHHDTAEQIRPRVGRAARGFTLIELLVVIGIIVVLIAITLVVGQAVIGGARSNLTRDILRTLDKGVDGYVSDKGSGPAGFAIIPTDSPGSGDLVPVFDGVMAGETIDGADALREASLNSVAALLLAMNDAGSAEAAVAQIDGKFVRQAPIVDPEETSGAAAPLLFEQLTIEDAFGNPIRAVHPRFDGLIGASVGQMGSGTDVTKLLATRATAGDGSDQTDRQRLPSTLDELRRNGLTDSDGGTASADKPYFYSAGADGARGEDADFSGSIDPDAEDGRADNVYTIQPKFATPIRGRQG